MMAPAIEDLRPRLCWVSASYVESVARLREQLWKLGEVAAHRGARVICGGRAIGEDLKHERFGVTFLSDLNELNDFAAVGRDFTGPELDVARHCATLTNCCMCSECCTEEDCIWTTLGKGGLCRTIHPLMAVAKSSQAR